jgi:hypothetical protein
MPLESPKLVTDTVKILTEKEKEKYSNVRVEFKIKKKIKTRIRGEKLLRQQIEDTISDDLKIIGDFYKGRVKNPVALSHKAKRRRIMEERYRNNKYIPVKKRYKDYLNRKWGYEYDEDKVDPDAYVFYKDVSLSIADARELELYEWLEKMGIKTKKKSLSKNARKVVRKKIQFKSGDKKKKKKNKKKKKGKDIMKTKFMSNLASKEYNSWKDFAKEVQSLTMDTLRKELG